MKGFTLIELLVVMSIISVLSSVMLVSLQSARLAAMDAAQIEAAAQLRIAINSYNLDHKAYPPIPYDEDLSGNVIVGTPTHYGFDAFTSQLMPLLLSGNYISSSLTPVFYRQPYPIQSFIYAHRCDAQTPCNSGDLEVIGDYVALTQQCSSLPTAVFYYTLHVSNQTKVDCFY